MSGLRSDIQHSDRRANAAAACDGRAEDGGSVLMSVWWASPSVRPAAEANVCLEKWRKQGYKLCLWRDTPEDLPIHDLLLVGPYPGHAKATNECIDEVLKADPECLFIANSGDDTEPDLAHTGSEIVQQCVDYFRIRCAGCLARARSGQIVCEKCGGTRFEESSGTFGVLQCTGDRFAGGSIDRIAGSPFIGREFCERAYGGKGPLFDQYWHMRDDDELMAVAVKLGVFWQRPDLIHLHHHFTRETVDINSNAVGKPIPAFLQRANSKENWDAMGKIFFERQTAGFPGHEPV